MMDVDQLIQMGLDILRYWGCFIACLAPADCPAAFPLSALPYLSLTEESLFVHSIASFTVEGIDAPMSRASGERVMSGRFFGLERSRGRRPAGPCSAPRRLLVRGYLSPLEAGMVR